MVGIVDQGKKCDVFFFQGEDGKREAQESRGLGNVYKRQGLSGHNLFHVHKDPCRRATPDAPETPAHNRGSTMRAIQAGWTLAYEAESCSADEFPSNLFLIHI